jgi:hypothetical protein
MGGGVMCYVRDDICARRTEPIVDAKVDNDVYATSDFEVLWLILRPKVLPRPYSQLIVIVVYCPPWYEAGRKRALSKFLTAGIDFFARIHPCAIFSLVGDFNSLDTNFFTRHHDLRQLVKSNTRGNKILDKIFTNCYALYNNVEVCAPLGRSDHNSVVIRADSSERCVVGSKTVLKRDFNNEAYECIERDLNSVNWSLMYRMSNC